METTDLMIGDWFRCSDPMPFKIESITKDDGYSIVVGDDGFEVCVGDLEPIPLTPETLDKNNFHNYSEISRMWHKDKQGLVLAFVYGDSIEMEITGYCELPYRNFRGGIRYIHQFQHVLRLCGLTELADNFKI